MNEYDSNRIYDSVKKIGFNRIENYEKAEGMQKLIQSNLAGKGGQGDMVKPTMISSSEDVFTSPEARWPLEKIQRVGSDETEPDKAKRIIFQDTGINEKNIKQHFDTVSSDVAKKEAHLKKNPDDEGAQEILNLAIATRNTLQSVFKDELGTKKESVKNEGGPGSGKRKWTDTEKFYNKGYKKKIGTSYKKPSKKEKAAKKKKDDAFFDRFNKIGESTKNEQNLDKVQVRGGIKRFMGKFIDSVQSGKLDRNKQKAILYKVVKGLGISPRELQMYVQKVKQGL